MEPWEKYLRALVLLETQTAMVEGSIEKPELLLVKAGFTAKEAAFFVQKRPSAVQKAVQRSKKRKRK